MTGDIIAINVQHHVFPVMDMWIVLGVKPAVLDIDVKVIVLLDVMVMFATKNLDHAHMVVYLGTIRIQMAHAVGAPLDVLSA